MRIRQRDDLAAVRRIGQDFLIAGDRGIEHDFAGGDAGRANRRAAKHRAISEDEDGWLTLQHVMLPGVDAESGTGRTTRPALRSIIILESGAAFNAPPVCAMPCKRLIRYPKASKQR